MKRLQKYTVHLPEGEREFEVGHDGEVFLVRSPGGEGAREAGASPCEVPVVWEARDGDRFFVRLDGRPMECRLSRLPDGSLRVEWLGRQLVLRVADELTERGLRAPTHAGGPIPLRSPMPGTVVKVLVAEGDLVQVEQPLCIVEAMKMQNELDAPVAGRIVRLSLRPGQAVEGDQVLMEIRPE